MFKICEVTALLLSLAVQQKSTKSWFTGISQPIVSFVCSLENLVGGGGLGQS
jgi:hypothetical protein